MAISWSGGSGLFDKLGKLVKTVNKIDESGSTDALPAIDAFIDLLTEATDERQVGTAITTRDNLRSALSTQAGAVRDLVVDLLNNEIIPAEGLGSFRAQADILNLLRYYMGRDAQGVRESAPTIGGGYETTATAQSSPFTNDGDATIFATIKGTLAPMAVSGTISATETTKYASHPTAQLNEGVLPDTYEIRCTQDVTNGASSGAERFSVEGSRLPVANTDHDWKHAGNRGTLTIQSSSSGTSKVTNGGFETVTGLPNPVYTGWTLSPGVTGTNLADVTADKLRGTRCANMIATAGVSPKLKQTLSGMKGKTKYLVTFAAKKQANGQDATATFVVALTGTGWTPHASEQISRTTQSGGTLSSSWTRYGFWVNTPDQVPTDIAIEITLTAGPGAAYPQVYVDEVLVIEATPYADGLSLIGVANATDSRVDDRYTLAVTNAMAGIFQTFFTRLFNYVIPSVPNGTTGMISESLAT